MAEDGGNQTARLLITGAMVAAGALASAACGPGGAVVALTGAGVLQGALGSLASIAQNIFATDAHARLARRMASPERLFRNHDLTKAVGDAIALVLRSMADEERRTSGGGGLVRLGGSAAQASKSAGTEGFGAGGYGEGHPRLVARFRRSERRNPDGIGSWCHRHPRGGPHPLLCHERQ